MREKKASRSTRIEALGICQLSPGEQVTVSETEAEIVFGLKSS